MVNRDVSFLRRKFLILRFLLPASLVIACLMRINVVSFGYGLLALISPLIPTPVVTDAIPWETRRYLQVVLATGLTASLAQLLFHVSLLASPPYGRDLMDCSPFERTCRQFGFQPLDKATNWQLARLIAPEILVCFVAMYAFVKVIRKRPKHISLSHLLFTTIAASPLLQAGQLAYHQDEDEEEKAIDLIAEFIKRQNIHQLFQRFSNALTIALIAFSGMVYPSFISMIYFAIFLALTSWWSTNRQISEEYFAKIKFFLLVYSALHLILLYLYQFEFFQTALTPDLVGARFLGFTALILPYANYTCDVREWVFYPYAKWPHFLNPFVLMTLYAAMAHQLISYWTFFSTSTAAHAESDLSLPPPEERSMNQLACVVPPPSAVQPIATRKKQPSRWAKLFRHGDKVTITTAAERESLTKSRSHSLENADEDDGEQDMAFTEIVVPKSRNSERRPANLPISSKAMRAAALNANKGTLNAIGSFINQQSYVLSLIMMMAWSITYHSWSTFVLLFIACVGWMVPNPKSFCFGLSPFIAAYANLLLVVQFIYGLDLNEAELPDKHPAILAQIGFQKPESTQPCVTLAVKTFYSIMFWVTLRQHLRSKQLLARKEFIEGAVGLPFHVAFTTLRAGDTPEQIEEAEALLKEGEDIKLMETSALSGVAGAITEDSAQKLRAFGAWLKRFLTKYWIFISAFFLLMISLRTPVVVYRIIYMVFFLVFITVFQISFRCWRLMLYYYYMIMIVYCMIVLSLIYTYQFHGFPDLWRNGTRLSDDVLLSIGLESYNSGELFVKLLTPIFFLIVMIIQITFFHKDLMVFTEKLQLYTSSKYCLALETKPSLIDADFKDPNFAVTSSPPFFGNHVASPASPISLPNPLSPEVASLSKSEKRISGSSMEEKWSSFSLEDECSHKSSSDANKSGAEDTRKPDGLSKGNYLDPKGSSSNKQKPEETTTDEDDRYYSADEGRSSRKPKEPQPDSNDVSDQPVESEEPKKPTSILESLVDIILSAPEPDDEAEEAEEEKDEGGEAQEQAADEKTADAAKDATTTTSGSGEKPPAKRKFSRSHAKKRKSGRLYRLFKTLYPVFKYYQTKAVSLLWRFLEVHIAKIICFIMMYICVSRVSALNFPYILFIVITLPFEHWSHILSHVACVWTCCVIITKMLYQMQFVKEEDLQVVCSNFSKFNITTINNPTAQQRVDKIDDVVNSTSWGGLDKADDVSDYLQCYVLLILLLTLQSLVHMRQKYNLIKYNQKELPRGILLPGIERYHADESFRSCIKYFINFFFYKFGLEICYLATVATLGVRMDFQAILYAIWLMGLLSQPRTKVAKIWSYYLIYLGITLPLQYLMCMGLPPTACVSYPWTEGNWNVNLVEWLYLPEYTVPPNPMKLGADFVQFLCVSCQWYVFRIEQSKEADDYPGGDNKELIYDRPHPDTNWEENPVPDFITFTKSYLDLLKVMLFMYLYWATLAFVFIAGVSRVTMFAMGYVVACFLFLWVGNELFLRPLQFACKLWNTLIAYTVTVIFIKTSLQVIGCVYLLQLFQNYCWVLQLFGIACLKSSMDPARVLDTKTFGDCKVPVEEAGIKFDGICFFFLLLQRRIFCSNYFKHVIAEFRAQQVFASRGAELINKLTLKEIGEQQARERAIVAKIKRKMEKIRQTHQQTVPPADVSTIAGSEAGDRRKSMKSADEDEALHSFRRKSLIWQKRELSGLSASNTSIPIDGLFDAGTNVNLHDDDLVTPPAYTSLYPRLPGGSGLELVSPSTIRAMDIEAIRRHVKRGPKAPTAYFDGSLAEHLKQQAAATLAQAEKDAQKPITPNSAPCHIVGPDILPSPGSAAAIPFLTTPEDSTAVRRSATEISQSELLHRPKRPEASKPRPKPTDLGIWPAEIPTAVHAKRTSILRRDSKPDDSDSAAQQEAITSGSSVVRRSTVGLVRSIPRSSSSSFKRPRRRVVSDASSRWALVRAHLHRFPEKFANMPPIDLNADEPSTVKAFFAAFDENSDEESGTTRSRPPEMGPDVDVEEDRRKGLGPLQLLNVAFKKGDISKAVKDAQQLEKQHIQLEKLMQERTGRADQKEIRKRLKHSVPSRPLADFEEDTFDEEPISAEFTKGGYLVDLQKRYPVRKPPTLAAIERSDTSRSRSISEASPTTRKSAIRKPASLMNETLRPEHKPHPHKTLEREGSRHSVASKQIRKHLGDETPQISMDQPSLDEEDEDELEEDEMISDEEAAEKEQRPHHRSPAPAAETAKLSTTTKEGESTGKQSSIINSIVIAVADKSKNAYIFAKIFIGGVIESMITWLLKVSRDYRYVAQVMAQEKRTQKETFVTHQKARKFFISSSSSASTPKGETKTIPARPDSVATLTPTGSIKIKINRVDRPSIGHQGMLSHFQTKPPMSPTSLGPTSALYSEVLPPGSKSEGEETDEFGKQQNMFVRLFVASYYVVISRSELFCYLMMVLDHMNQASILSMILPFMAFLWGTLSVPRPSKLFWISVITYTEAMVVIKYLFQFGFFPWNKSAVPPPDPFWPPRILGIEKKEKYAGWDLALLMALFFHRSILKTMGLWKDSDMDVMSFADESSRGSSRRSSKYSKHSIHSKHSTLLPMLEPERKSPIIAGHASVATAATTGTATPGTIGSDTTKSSRRRFALPSILIATSEDAANQAKETRQRINKGMKAYITSVINFFGSLLRTENRASVDAYVPMFLCDFVCFLIVVFGYHAFGTDQGAGGVTSYFEENKVPVPFLIMLIVQFGLIIIDRALFLKKYLLGKLAYQCCLVVFIHVWMFMILPAITERMFQNNFPAKLWYFVKCIYFCLSAWQIRQGYPTRILGNFLTKKYNYINMLLFKGFMLIPFLFELRALMDWIWTETCMNLSDWFKLEDIYANIYLIKCARKVEEDYPTPRGAKQRPLKKYGCGGCFLLSIIFIIWFPLVLFSLANTVGMRNLPNDCTVKFSIGQYQPIYQMSAQDSYMQHLSDAEFSQLQQKFRLSKMALSYLAEYSAEDVVRAVLQGKSNSIWGISPPSKEHLIRELEKNTSSIDLKFEWHFTRPPEGKMEPVVTSAENIITLKPDNPVRVELAEMLKSRSDGNRTTPKSVLIPKLVPHYVKVPGRGAKAFAAAAMSSDGPTIKPANESFLDVLITLESGAYETMGIGETFVEWWQLKMINPEWKPPPTPEPGVEGSEVSTITDESAEDQQQKELEQLEIFGFVDKVFPAQLNFFTGGGILSFYLSLVLLVGRLARSIVTGAMYRILYEELPNVDRILQLCLDIFLVRESRELELEEDLFAKLIFLYRSPATLIKWTRKKDK